MRILLLGNNGQLGSELQRCLALLGEIVALDYPQIDFTHLDHLRQVVLASRPQVIVNAVAFTAVDRAESESQLAMTINGLAPRVLAETALSLGVAIIHYSTDYVFNGKKNLPYTEKDQPDPLNVYGLSKLAGDHAIMELGGAYLILRTSWLFSLHSKNFLTNVLAWARSNPEMHVVTDQVGSPNWARHVAEATGLLLAQGGENPAAWIEQYRGLYNLTSSGYASRFEWAEAILKLDPHPAEQIVRKLSPALSAEFPTAAQRPLFTALDGKLFSQTFGLRLPDWHESLRLAMETG